MSSLAEPTPVPYSNVGQVHTEPRRTAALLNMPSISICRHGLHDLANDTICIYESRGVDLVYLSMLLLDRQLADTSRLLRAGIATCATRDSSCRCLRFRDYSTPGIASAMARSCKRSSMMYAQNGTPRSLWRRHRCVVFLRSRLRAHERVAHAPRDTRTPVPAWYARGSTAHRRSTSTQHWAVPDVKLGCCLGRD